MPLRKEEDEGDVIVKLPNGVVANETNADIITLFYLVFSLLTSSIKEKLKEEVAKSVGKSLAQN